MNEDDKILIKKATYANLIIAWLLFVTPIPFISFIGIALNLGAIILSIISINNNEVKSGLISLLLSTAVSTIIYMIGWFILISVIGSNIERHLKLLQG